MIFGYTPGTLNQIQLEVIFQRTQWSLNGGASSAQASDPFSLRQRLEPLEPLEPP